MLGAPGFTLAMSGSAYVARHVAAACSIAFEIVDRIGAVAHAVADNVGGGSFGALAVAVRVEELPVGGDRIPAHRRLLVPQRGLQLVRRDAGRLDVVDQLAVTRCRCD